MLRTENEIANAAKYYALEQRSDIARAFYDGYKQARKDILNDLEDGVCEKYDAQLATVMKLYTRIDYDKEGRGKS